MKRFTLPLLLAFAAGAFAQEEAKPLTIGDPAPAFKIDGHIKGENVTELKKGKAYVIEFWATWCGPCIAVFPHLSELTKKYEGKVTTVSVNTWDYPRGQSETKEDHTKRVAEFVEKQGDKMAYNIVLDDDKDTIATTWMRAAGQNGIPCAFIVNEEGIIAWIGHPATMDQPLEAVVNKTWDLQAFKTKFDAQAAKAKEAAALAAEVVKVSKAGDMEAFDGLVAKLGVEAIYAVMNGDHNFAVKALEKYSGKIEDLDGTTVCSMLAYLVGQKDTNEESKAAGLKLSEKTANAVKEEEAALAHAYHARALFAAGKKDEAKVSIKKASDLVAKFMPEQQRPGIQKFIDDTAKSFDVAN